MLTFISDIDGKRYDSLYIKTSERREYLSEIIKSGILWLGTNKISNRSEKIPLEAGYTLDFGRSTINFDDWKNDIRIERDFDTISDADSEIHEHISREIYLGRTVVTEIKKGEEEGFIIDFEKYDSDKLSEYYTDIIWNVFKPKINRPTIIWGPPNSGLSFEEAIKSKLMNKYYEFIHGESKRNYYITSLEYASDRKKSKDMKKISNHKDVLIVDDCLITGNSIRREAKKIKSIGLKPSGVLVGFDAGLYGKSGKKVYEELQDELEIPVKFIVNAEESIMLLDDYIKEREIFFANEPKSKLEKKERKILLPQIMFINKDYERIVDKVNDIYTKRNKNKYLVDTIFGCPPRNDILYQMHLLDCEYLGSQGRELFNKKIYKPFVQFMRAQKEIVDLQKTVEAIRTDKRF